MKKSFMDRIFPHPAGSVYTKHDDSRMLPTSRAATARDSSRSVPGPVISSSSSQQLSHSLRSAPLSTSLLHHDDPFLPIERASKALQETIQSLLDIQSAKLNGRVDTEAADSLSNGSLTPTPSTTSELLTHPRRTVPIRQPPKKRITLRSARKGLRRCMQDFALLREEELRMLEQQSKSRMNAIQQVNDLEERKNVLAKQIESIKSEEHVSTAKTFRNEAKVVHNEIQELEHRLLELRVRHRHLISQAEQIENAAESKASSYHNTLTLVEKDVKDFLKRPPIQHPLARSANTGMYTLQPHRRTLEMAKEQWSTEQDCIAQRTVDAEAERHALVEGERMWSEALERIDAFEAKLRFSTNDVSNSISQTTLDAQGTLTTGLGSDLDQLIQSLQNDFDHAEEQNWNLLVCAIGAEIDACTEARKLLDPNLDAMENMNDHADVLDIAESPTTARQSPQKPARSPTNSAHSNQSLKDTLNEFGNDALAAATTDRQGQTANPRYESEDDEPPADFLLSR